MSAPTQDLVAAFLAKGGTVTRAHSDERTIGYREMYRAVRGLKDPVVLDESEFYREQPEELAREAFGSARANGASVEVAMDDYNEMRLCRRNRKGWR